MAWIDVLTSWGYPRAYELAPVLEELGLCPEKYRNPYELASDLQRMSYEELRTQGIFDPIINFFKWLWEQFMGFLHDYGLYIGLIIAGGLITWFASGWYKALGAIPIIGATIGMLKKAEVI